MSELLQVVTSLQNKVSILVEKLQALTEINDGLLSEIQETEETALKQSYIIDMLQKENDSLRMANSLLGSDDFRRETKLKINSIIREIDYCIDQLSE